MSQFLPDLDFTTLTRHQLKSLAFLYHYEQWRTAEEAKSSIAGRAAAEQARRAGVPLHEPVLIKWS